MSKQNLKDKTVYGVVWSSVERFSVQGIQFFVLLIMARLLSPHEYGVIGMLTIFIALAQVIVDSGFSQALIRKQDRTETDNCTVFYFNLIVSCALYCVFFAIAPLVANFYNTPELTSIMRVLCLGVIINSIGVIQIALFTISIDFKTLAKASAAAAFLSGIVGIYLAYHGFGVWALVCQQLASLTINVLVLWLCSKWRPGFLFSWDSIKSFFGFSSKLLITGSLEAVFQNLYQVVIGKFFPAAVIGYYTRALQFVSLPSSNIGGIIQRVTYPVFCEVQEDNQKLSVAFLKVLNVLAFVVFPMMIFLSFFSDDIIWLLLGVKWMETSILMRLLSISMLLYPVHALNLNMLIVKGRTDYYLRVDIIKKVLTVIILIVTIPLGIIAMCYGQILNSFISFFINTYFNGKLIGLGAFKQIQNMFPILIMSIVIGFVAYYAATFCGDTCLIRIVIGLVVYTTLYLGLSFAFKLQVLEEAMRIIKR